MYRPVPSIRDRSATLTAVVLVHVALALALLNLSGAVRLPDADELTQLIDIPAEPPPPPIVESQPETARPKKQEGAASAKNIESQATPVVAPKPLIEVPTPQPIIASPTPAQGAQPTQGASNVVGPGTGAGGSGTGTGSGGSGSGAGGGGAGIAERARLLTPSLRTRDYPPYLRERLQSGAPPFVLFTVEPSGRVYNCRIYRPSGDPEIDRATCALVTARFVYRPAINQRGQPVASDNGYEQRN
ncbi:MAG: energy transducer TonB [Sphingomonas bacterium]|nr:energy transducer TonB [Sphingomonas bacterium]